MSTEQQRSGANVVQQSKNLEKDFKGMKLSEEEKQTQVVSGANVREGTIKQQQMQGKKKHQTTRERHEARSQKKTKGMSQQELRQIPVSLYELESCVLQVPILHAWNILKHFKLQDIVPSYVKKSEFTQGAPGQIDSIVRIDFVDGAVWEIRLVEYSEVRRSIAWEVLTTEPAHKASSIQGSLTLKPVTKDEMTFVEWVTEFSNDADIEVIEDQRFKKFDFFEDAARALKNISSQQQQQYMGGQQQFTGGQQQFTGGQQQTSGNQQQMSGTQQQQRNV
eukprot:403377048